jgi:hypothetical protein
MQNKWKALGVWVGLQAAGGHLHKRKRVHEISWTHALSVVPGVESDPKNGGSLTA